MERGEETQRDVCHKSTWWCGAAGAHIQPSPHHSQPGAMVFLWLSSSKQVSALILTQTAKNHQDWEQSQEKPKHFQVEDSKPMKPPGIQRLFPVTF